MTRTSYWRLAAPLLAFSLILTGCSGGSTDEDNEPATNIAPADTHVPVSMATASSMDLDIVVNAQGRTRALKQDRIRAPFDSRLQSLEVTDGDQVSKGQLVALIVSKDSEATLDGARQMLSVARSAKDKADAKRAISIAKQNLVERRLTAPAAGIVLSHTAETGDYVDASEVLATIAESDSVYFEAAVAQSDANKVHAGQTAHIDIPALGASDVGAVVRGLLPMASSTNFSAPVRLDFAPTRQDVPLGLFGTASIIVAHHADATVVPKRAVLRDDVTGTTRLAIVTPSNNAHWITVTTGVRENGLVEILSPTIKAGTRIITDGQVGLPEGAGVVSQ